MNVSRYGLYFANHNDIMSAASKPSKVENNNNQVEAAWRRLLDDEQLVVDGMPGVKALVLCERKHRSHSDLIEHWTFDAYDAQSRPIGTVHVYEDPNMALRVFPGHIRNKVQQAQMVNN